MSLVSESKALRRMRGALREIEQQVTMAMHGDRKFAVLDLVKEIDRFAATLQSQVGRGVHKNPPLVIYGNPPLIPGKLYGERHGASQGRFRFAGHIGRDVHEVRYTHVEDGKDYKHIFDSGDVEMYAIIRGDNHDVLLTGGSGQPLWKDFE